MENDRMKLTGLRLATRIGVPEEERKEWQTLVLDLEIEPLGGRFVTASDALEDTVDYSALAAVLRHLAASRPRRLIETLAEELAALTLDRFPVACVTLELRKQALPGCDHVAVRLSRSQPAPPPSDEIPRKNLGFF